MLRPETPLEIARKTQGANRVNPNSDLIGGALLASIFATQY